MPIRDVLKAAGVNLQSPEPGMPATSTSDNYISALQRLEAVGQNCLKKRRNTMQDFGVKVTRRKQSVDSGSSGAMYEGSRQSLTRMSSQEAEWMESRTKSLDNLRQKMDFRRAFVGDTADPTNVECCLNGAGPCVPVIEEDVA